MQPSYFNQAISQPAKLIHALRVAEVHINSSPVSDPCFSAFIIQYGEKHSSHNQSRTHTHTHTRQRYISEDTVLIETVFLYIMIYSIQQYTFAH